MSSSEIQNLLVRIEPEGVEKTTDELEQQGEQFEETADTVKEESGRMEEFSQRWSGAMTTLVAGLAIATAGLLTQVPVIGELFGGLTAIIDALAFQIDRALRPALSGLTTELFDISAAMFAADGPIEALDILAEKIADIGAATISIAIEEDVVATAVDNLIEIVFPKIGKTDLLSAIFQPDISSAAVLTFLFGSTAIAASKVLTFMLPASISATAILTFMLPIIGISAIVAHVFDVNMTETLILSTLFGGIAIAGLAIVGAISWPAILGASILGAIFGAAVVVSKEYLMDWIFGDASNVPEDVKIPGGGAGGGGTQTPGGVPAWAQDMNPNQTASNAIPGTENATIASGALNIIMNGRQLTEDTGRYRADNTSRRGRGP